MLKSLHPLSKLVVCVVALTASITVFDARFQAALFASAFLALLVINRTPLLTLLALTVPFALFGFGFLTTSILFRQESDFAVRIAGEALWHRQGLSAGIVLFSRALACGMISAFFALTTDPGAFVRSLMLHLKLPPRIGYSLFAAMQLVPDLAAEAQQMRFARAMKAGRIPRRIPRPMEAASLVIPLLAYAIRRAGRTAMAMEARGLSPDGPRTILNAPRFKERDAVFAVVGLGVIAGCGIVTLL
ncbi:energy-coupling factor transporter transmembrane protein EcfT [Microvirga sp. 2YAF29]|uniref:energy-coupling factor transporter transmembrane component T family protein n=1 Tax=Microvirga sp. 2YAF29 TaxID=3233031 RepID=UPI003F958D87